MNNPKEPRFQKGDLVVCTKLQSYPEDHTFLKVGEIYEVERAEFGFVRLVGVCVLGGISYSWRDEKFEKYIPRVDWASNELWDVAI